MAQSEADKAGLRWSAAPPNARRRGGPGTDWLWHMLEKTPVNPPYSSKSGVMAGVPAKAL